MFAGVMGATVAAVFSLRKVRATADPYSVPFAAALLKLPTGALTATLGLLLIRGGFVAGFTGLDSSAQIIAWAIVLGFSQELFTALVDKQARDLLTAGPGGDDGLPHCGRAADQAAFELDSAKAPHGGGPASRRGAGVEPEVTGGSAA